MSPLKRFCLVLMALILAACSAPAAAPTATALATLAPPTATFTPLPTATLAPKPTATLAPTSTLTPVPTDTPIPTPAPSPTPAGYYRHAVGFSMIIPPGWTIFEQHMIGVSLVETATSSMLMVDELAMVQVTTLDDFVKYWLKDAFAQAERGQLGEMTLADGLKAPSVDYRLKNADGVEISIRFAVFPQGARHYGFMLFAKDEVFQARQQSYNSLLSSVQLHNWVYFLERSQVIAQVGSQPDPEDLDPALTQVGAYSYTGLLFAGLVRLDQQLRIEPDLAEKWTVSPDGLTYTFTLRPGLKFQSGAALTAADVKYSWERATDPKTKSPTAGTYLDDIVGVKDKLAGQATEVAGIKVIDERTLAVTLDGPRSYFLAKLTYPTSFVVRRGNVESSADQWMFKPDASGPYGLRSLSENEAMIFERNPAYYQPAKMPYLLFYLDPIIDTPLSLYQAGKTDLAHVFGDSAVQVGQASSPLHAELQSGTSLCTSMLRLDITKPPLDDVNVRRALALALDRDKLIEQLNLNLDQRANTVLPPAMPGYSADRSAPEFDVKAARQALTASKYAGQMPELVINEVGQAGKPSDLVAAIVQMWRQNLGLTNIKVVAFDSGGSPTEKRAQHGNIVRGGWCADYPDPQNFLDILFHSGSDFNAAGYADAETDRLLEQARVEPDPSRRLDLYAQVETRLLEEVAVIPLWHTVDYVLVKPYLKGYVQSAMDVPRLHLLSIEGFVEP